MKRFAAVLALLLPFACTRSGDDAGLVPDYVVHSPDGARHLVPRYSPDGSHIAYWAPASDPTAGWQVWVANADLSGAIALPVTALGAAPIAWSPDGTRIVTSHGANADLIVAPANGTAARVIANTPAFEFPVGWHPDGDRVLYYASAKGSIRSSIVSVSTGKVTPFADTLPSTGFWSPDGSRVVYFQFNGSKVTLWLADSAAQNPRQLTKEGFEVLAFTFGISPWSPDGKEVLYLSSRTGTTDVWVLNVETGATRQITRDVRNDFAPVWSPDGKSIAFGSERGRQTDLWIAPAAGGGEQRLTDSERAEGTPIWRPRTNEIAFIGEDVRGSVWARALSDGAERQLTPDSLRVDFFNVSPDGNQMSYTVNRGGGVMDLAVMPLAGGASRTLLTGNNIGGGYWSPDGSKLTFDSDRGGTTDPWVVDVATGTLVQLVSWSGFDFGPAWSSDGAWLYFNSDHEARLGDIWKVPAAGGTATRVTRDGSTNGLLQHRRRNDNMFVSILDQAGTPGYALLTPDGRWKPLNYPGAAYALSATPFGDSVAIGFGDPKGIQVMMLPVNGGKGRTLLALNEGAGPFSDDGKQLLYYIPGPGGTSDLGILDVATGAKRRLTTTPENEAGIEFTPDGKSIVFRRMQTTQRVTTLNASKLLTAGSK